MSPSRMDDRDENDFSFREYRRLFLTQLADLQNTLKEARQEIAELRQKDLAQLQTDLALLKFKAGMIGAGASILVTIGASLLGRLGH